MRGATSPESRIITEDDIKDRSKADAFTKLFAVAQSGWLILESIARLSSGLPLTQIELATMAYIVTAAVMYGYWLEKPFGVEHVTIVPCDEDVTLLRVKIDSDEEEERHLEEPWEKVGNGDRWTSFLVVGMEKTEDWKLMLALYGTGTIFCAFHIGAWNWEFGSPIARLLWRIFSVSSTAICPCFALYVPYYTWVLAMETVVSRNEEYAIGWRGHLKLIESCFSWFGVLLFGAYSVSRLMLIGLIVYSLTSMPAGAYMTVDWATYLPNFS